MVQIITDSASDLPPELTAKYNIRVVPANVWFGPEKYVEGVEIEKHQFYDLLVSSPLVPRTTHAGPRRFLQEFRRANDRVLAIMTSRKLSPFYNSASLAVAKFKLGHVTVFDSGTVSMGLGQMVLHAAKLLENGYSVDDILGVLERMKRRQSLFVLLDTLKYVVRGGRAKRSQEVLSNLLNIKPILEVKEGELLPSMRAFGYEKAKEEILMEAVSRYSNDRRLLASVLYSTNLMEGQEFYSAVQARLDPKTLYIGKVGSSVGSNVGPNALALAIAPELYP